MKKLLLLLALLAVAAQAEDSAIRDLVQELANDDPYVRETATKNLLKRGDEAVPVLVEALSAESARLREEAARALGAFGERAVSAAAALEKALKDEESAVRRAAAEAIAKIAPEWNPVGRIEALLKTKEHAALLAMLERGIQDATALPVLVRLLEHERSDLRAATAGAIGRYGSDAGIAVEALIRTGRSTNWAVRFAVRDALSAIGAPSAAPLIKAWAGVEIDVDPWAAGVFFELGPKATVAGLNALQSEDEDLRAAAARALGAAGPASVLAAPRLMKALHDPSGDVRRESARALGGIGKDALDAVPGLVSLAGDSERLAAPDALRALGAIVRDASRPATGGSRVAGVRDAITQGLAWLAAHQDEDGGWDCDGFSKHDPKDDKCGGPGGKLYDIGVTGLALLAFLEAAPGRDDDDLVRRAARYLVTHQDEDGFFGTRETVHYIYNHGIATVALCVAYMRTRDPLYGRAAAKGLRFIEYFRNPESAWRYEPRGVDDDASVTGWMVFALKMGELAGLDVDRRAYDGALAFLKTVTNAQTGSAGYMKGMTESARPDGLHRTFPPSKTRAMTAAAILARIHIAGDPRLDPLVKLGANECVALPPRWAPGAGWIDMYYWFQATRALAYVGGTPWSKWAKAIKKAIMPHQHRKGTGSRAGSWDPVSVWGKDGGRVYSTALMVLCLEALDGRATPLRYVTPREGRVRAAIAVLRKAAIHEQEAVRHVAENALSRLGIRP